MTRRQLTASAFIFTLGLSAAIPAAADPHRSADSASLQLPITGTTATGASFAGTFTLTRFANRGGRVVAVGFVRGTLTAAAGLSLGTQAAFSFDLTLLTSEGLGAYRALLAHSDPFRGETRDCHLERSAGFENIGTTRLGPLNAR